MDEWKGLKAGLEASVSDSDTAIAVGSGEMPVLGTPRLIALCEQATVAAISGVIPAEQTSVGVTVNVEHLKASVVGANVSVHAEVVSVQGKKLVFAVEAREKQEVIMRGEIARVVVNRERFMDKLK